MATIFTKIQQFPKFPVKEIRLSRATSYAIKLVENIGHKNSIKFVGKLDQNQM
jgi:hypothetical protein